ncbi:uncharacterized protein LOC106753071 [Vigna radiata var. radiata]|uniref:Uncharacterized protein LOC106753071 n=1 Tax=Vigna radiata var. radiata TaxID=3916 RepID=A0A1S3T9A2_VIGRR|nr:uncharacterized protein LOC106753071 [Vigna radiata var. radiata]
MIVTTYYTKLKKLWDELGSYSNATCTCGADNKRRKLMQFLMGLNDSYSAIRGQILLMNPLPDVTQAYSSIIQEEKQRHLSTARDTIEASAMAIQNNEPIALVVRRKQGSSSRLNSSNRKLLHFSHCDRDYHTKDTCWKLHGYPPEHPKHGATKNAYSKHNGSSQSLANIVTTTPMMQSMQSTMHGLIDLQLQQMLSIIQGNESSQSANPKANNANFSSGLSPPKLIIDSGATDHIISKPTLLVNSKENTSLPPVVMPNGDRPQLSLLDLMTRTTIGLGKQQGGLYYLVAMTSNKSQTPIQSIATHVTKSSPPSNTSTTLWHRRLGHLSPYRLDFMAKTLLNLSLESNKTCDTGEVAQFPENQLQVIVFFWDLPLSLGEQRGRRRFLYPQQKLNIEHWLIQDGSVATKYVPSAEQLADVFTKPLGKEMFSIMKRKLVVLDIHSPN